MATVGPVVDQLPTAPNRGMSSAQYPIIADAWAAKIGPWTTQVNALTTWMGGIVDATFTARDAAAASAQAASSSAIQAGLKVTAAAEQVALANTARQGAEAAALAAQTSAQAAGDAAGFPAFVDGLDVLQVKPDKTGVQWGKVGQAIGDVLETTRTPDATYLLPDTVYTRAAYPELFAIVGTQGEKNDASNFANVANGLSAPLSLMVGGFAVGMGNVLIGVGANGQTTTGGVAVRSTDGGATWITIPTLHGQESLNSIATDGAGCWLATSYYSSNTIYKSTDNGVTFVKLVNAPGQDITQTGTATVIYGNNGFLWRATTSGNSVYSFTTDLGVTWAYRYYCNPISPYNPSRIIWDSVSSTWISGSNGLLFSKDNFATVLGSPRQIAGFQPNTLAVGGGVIGYISAAGMEISTDGGYATKIVNTGSFSSLAIDRNGLIVGYAAGRIYRSSDFGENFVSNLAIIQPNLALTVSDSNGNWVGPQAGTPSTFVRATRLYNYDVAAQFKTPAHKAPKGYKAYIKGKLA
ncbi:WD40/YVTN/BNR-like repeat-containing protein [Pseudomonas sp. DSP3-2-2]|uniref:WD40/YVTN/BNR-like repeat-containing protein n=1 Tax=unclassified Pseudomonas TaxID=196821 RepID=UPI003CFA9467